MVKITIVKNNNINTKGLINRSHLSYPTLTIAKDASISPVGLINAKSPIPY